MNEYPLGLAFEIQVYPSLPVKLKLQQKLSALQHYIGYVITLLDYSYIPRNYDGQQRAFFYYYFKKRLPEQCSLFEKIIGGKVALLRGSS